MEWVKKAISKKVDESRDMKETKKNPAEYKKLNQGEKNED